MSARTRHARFWLGLASSLTLAACAAENTPVQVPVIPPPLGPAHLILVVGDVNKPGDAAEVLENFLFDQLNFLVTVADDGENPALTPSRFQLIVISSSVDPATLGDRYRTTKLPVVVMHAGVFSAMGMTGSQAGASGTSPGTSVLVTPAGALHPIGQGFSGTLEVAQAPIRLNFGVPAASATVVATLADNPQRAAIFTYEAGATMSTLAAPGRRVGLFLDEDGDLTADGEDLVERSILWAALGHL